MKAIGKVENGADTVLDAFIEYMNEGMLVFPTHTWKQINDTYNIFNPITEPSCVGILSNLFLKRKNVVRSLHPTHSVAALGTEALDFISGEEQWDTPCPRKGCWGKLYDRKAKILFVGCSLRSNTIIHGVEEWNSVPERLAKDYQHLKIVRANGYIIDRPLRRHFNLNCDVSDNYGKLEEALVYTGIAKKGYIGGALSIICESDKMIELTTKFLKKDEDLFVNDEPIPRIWYI